MTNGVEGIPELFTAREVAQVLRISERSVWRLLLEKKIPAPLHVGRAARWKKSDIELWFETATQRRDVQQSLIPEMGIDESCLP